MEFVCFIVIWNYRFLIRKTEWKVPVMPYMRMVEKNAGAPATQEPCRRHFIPICSIPQN